MPLSLSAQNFLDVFAPSPTNVSSLEQEDPSSNSSQILDWIAEVLDTQSLDWGEPPLRVRNSLRNIGTGNEVLFDGLMRLLRFHLNNQGRQLAQSMAESSQRISNVPGLFEWIVSARQKSIYFASLAALVAEQVRLVTRCINAIFQATAMDPVVFLGLRECCMYRPNAQEFGVDLYFKISPTGPTKFSFQSSEIYCQLAIFRL
ncbi:hypothetical protein KL932_003986 [Ogataea haglerorum]|nr:hypothetical protein KL914_002581 [Ogataea haglerorum]KAG7709797.1 hypothetical protein KL950_002016 [Ogataea haglerorum]KAG7737683.1 hypothetical protein KL932_003986 [Ogataea haglerorum]KAG7811233.1 hypothetical protein KL924_001899 [Ogataea haglerorum]